MTFIVLYLHLLKNIQIINANREEGNVRMDIKPNIGAFMIKQIILSNTNAGYPFSFGRFIVMNELTNKPNAVENINVAKYRMNSVPFITDSIRGFERWEFCLCLCTLILQPKEIAYFYIFRMHII